MDVAKAKRVVIALLIAFNIFLLVNNLTFVVGQGVQKETIQSAEAILKQRGVTLECSIPTTPGGLHRLEYSYSKLDRQALAQTLLGSGYTVTGQEASNVQGVASVQDYEFEHSERKLQFISDTEFIYTDDQPAAILDISSEEKVRKVAQQFLEEAGLFEGKYVVDSLTRGRKGVVDQDGSDDQGGSNGQSDSDGQGNSDAQGGSATVVFIKNFDGFPVFDNYASVTLDQNGVQRLEYGKVHVNGFTQESIERFDAYQALLARFKMGSDLAITAIDSGYKLEDSSMNGVESVEMLPVWRVRIKGQSEPEYLYPFDSEK